MTVDSTAQQSTTTVDTKLIECGTIIDPPPHTPPGQGGGSERFEVTLLNGTWNEDLAIGLIAAQFMRAYSCKRDDCSIVGAPPQCILITAAPHGTIQLLSQNPVTNTFKFSVANLMVGGACSSCDDVEWPTWP